MFKGFLGIVDEGMGPDPIIVKLTDFQKTNCQVPTNLVVGDKYCVEWMGYDAMFNVEYFEGTDDEVKNHLSKLADSEGCNCDAGKCCCKDCSAKDSSFIDEILQGSTEPWPDDQVYRDSVSLQKI